MMIFEIVIALIVFACAIYYAFCFLEIMGAIKFTDENTSMEFPKWLIPFYYLFKK